MTPHQIGFMASRVLAIFVAYLSATLFAYTAYLFSFPSREGADRSFRYSYLVTFAAVFMLSVALWTYARWFGRAFVTEPRDNELAATPADFSAGLLRALGAFFVVMKGPGAIMLVLMMFGLGRGDNDETLSLLWLRQGEYVASFLQFVAGLVLLVGVGKVGRFVAGVPKRLWGATSLPDDEPTQQNPQ